MTQIKSEKAKEYAENAAFSPGGISYTLTYGDAYNGFIAGYEALEIAETEAEQRHAKELQELKDKAVDAFIENCYCTAKLFDDNNCEECYKVHSFTPKLNEK